MSLIKVKVVDESLLLEGLQKQRKATEESSDYKIDDNNDIINLIPSATTLILSFKNIAKIENLVGFNKLKKLCLDNNNIEVIKNLSPLVNLTWLDLSFNKITKIEGLEQLTQLEDLSLFNNQIREIEGLNNCRKLTCLSLGNNQIQSISNTLSLRRMKSLRMLTLSGNPLCQDSEYKKKIFAYFDNIQYLDYLLIDTIERKKCKQVYTNDILVLDQDDAIYYDKDQKDVQLHTEITQLKESRIYFTYTLFHDIFHEDKHMNKLLYIPGVQTQIDKYQSTLQAISNEYIQSTYERIKTQNIYMNKYHTSCQVLFEQNEQDKTALLNQLQDTMSQLSGLIGLEYHMNINSSTNNTLNIYANITSSHHTHNRGSSHHHHHHHHHKSGTLIQKEAQVTYKQFQEHVNKVLDDYEKVGDELMNLEVKLIESIDIYIDQLDDQYNDSKQLALEAHNTYFRSIEDLQEKFTSYLKTMCNDLMERLHSNEELQVTNGLNIPENYEEEVYSILGDKDTCMNIITASHEIHISRLLKIEEDSRRIETKWYIDIITTEKIKNHERNRMKILEVRTLCQQVKMTLNQYMQLEEDDDMFIEEETNLYSHSYNSSAMPSRVHSNDGTQTTSLPFQSDESTIPESTATESVQPESVPLESVPLPTEITTIRESMKLNADDDTLSLATNNMTLNETLQTQTTPAHSSREGHPLESTRQQTPQGSARPNSTRPMSSRLK